VHLEQYHEKQKAQAPSQAVCDPFSSPPQVVLDAHQGVPFSDKQRHKPSATFYSLHRHANKLPQCLAT